MMMMSLIKPIYYLSLKTATMGTMQKLSDSVQFESSTNERNWAINLFGNNRETVRKVIKYRKSGMLYSAKHDHATLLKRTIKHDNDPS